MGDTQKLHDKVKKLLYNFTGIALAENKDIMISNRLYKLQRDTDFSGSIDELLEKIENGEFINNFINSFTTNKTHFFREEFHFEDLKNRVVPEFLAKNSTETLKMYCSASSTGEEPYSMAMTIKEAQSKYNQIINSTIIATDIDTNVLQYAANGVYRYEKSSKEFPSWIKPQKYFKRRSIDNFGSQEIFIKAKDELRNMITFQIMNLNDDYYPFDNEQFDVIFCRNVLIYFTNEDQNKILKKLFRHLKIGGTLYIGHSENPHDLINYLQKIGQNIFVKIKEI